MGYRNNPIYMCKTKNKYGSLGYDFRLSVNKVSDDYRHSAPLVREILFEFLQGKYIAGIHKANMYFENGKIFLYDNGSFKLNACKITDNYLCSEYFLDTWSYYYFVDVFECSIPDECCDETKICTIFLANDELDWGDIYANKCFFYCSAREEKYIQQLEDISSRVVRDADRGLLSLHYGYNEWLCYDEGEEAYCSPDIDDRVGLNVIDWDYFGTQPRFDKYPLYLFNDEKGLSLATSPDCQYAALNRLLDGAVYRGLSEYFDLSIEFDTVSKAVFDFAGETDRCYRDGNKLVVRKMDDCMFSDFFRTYTIDTLFYPKGKCGEVKREPLFKLSFSPMGLNANLIASFEIYDRAVVETIKAVMRDIAEKYKRTLYFDAKPRLTQIPVTVTNKPREHLDMLLNAKCRNLNKKEKRLRREHNKIMMLRNGKSVPPTLWEKVTAFLNGKPIE